MNNKLLISKVFSKYRGTEGIYPLRKYSAYLLHGSQRKCKRVSALIKNELSAEDTSGLTPEVILDKMRSLEGLQDTEIHLFAYALTREVFLALLNEKLPLPKGISLLEALEDLDMEKTYSKLSEVNRILISKNPHHYRISDEATKHHIRERIYRYARRHKISEIEGAKIYRADKATDSPAISKLFFPMLLGLTALFSVPIIFLWGILPFFILILPIFEVIRALLLYITSRNVSSGFIPRREGQNIPKNAMTVTVITSLIDKDNLERLLEGVEDIYNRNREDNAVFGILGDLPEHTSVDCEEDREIIDLAKEGIKKLNARYGDHFCLFVRPRKYIMDSGKFSGWERKRGAIINLCALLDDFAKASEFECVILREQFQKGVKYLVTLDFDTIPGPNDIRRMVLAMLHPDNKPIIKGGKVTKGYGIMQPRIVLSPESAASSPFTLTLFGTGGEDNYRVPSFDFYQSLFGRGLFCGKGIIDIEVFNKVITPAFEEECILSHDILEGTYARCGYLTDTVLMDSCPKNPISYYKRLHRWIRGDVQASAYIGRKVTRASGESVKNPLDALSRFMLFDNILRAFLYPAVFLSLIYSLIFISDIAGFVALVGIAPIILPFIFTTISSLLRHPRKFYSNAVESICRSFCNTLYNISAIPTEAFTALDAILRSLWRMKISRKNLMQWTTSEKADKKSGAPPQEKSAAYTSAPLSCDFNPKQSKFLLNKKRSGFAPYLIRFLPSALTGLLFILFTSRPFLDLFGVLWLLFPITAYALSSLYPERPAAGESQKRQLYEYCRDAWKFYETFVGESTGHLPPDNFQETPSPRLAERTSPTNIGMYLLSVGAAYKFGFISKDIALERIKNTIKTLEALPKYKGHLYNWYDTSSLSVIGTPYISTVDSGNLIACLIALKGALVELGGEEEIELCEKLIDGAKFDFLYDSKKKLLSLGFNTATLTLTENCYDLMMSEARTAVYIALARGDVPDSAWYKMGRPAVMKKGHVGVMSWSGTAFEYFMPALFLPVYNGSIFYEALGFALSEQMRDRVQGFWGRSESAYFAFDYDMNYQYRAFGTKFLSYDKENLKNDVISPYSSFLALAVSNSQPLANLARLKKFGAYGKYGFYESIDFTGSRVGEGHAIIRSYMAHHVGMSILAALNCTHDNILIKWFMLDPAMRSGKTLLFEKIPTEVYIDKYKLPLTAKNIPQISYHLKRTSASDASRGEYLPDSASYSAGKVRFTLLSSGKVRAFYKNKALFYPFFNELSDMRGFGIRLKMGEDIIDPLKESEFTSYLTGAVYKGKKKGISYRTGFTLSETYSAFCVSLELHGNFRDVTPLVFFEPVLDTVPAFKAHPAFSGLSITSHYDEASGLLMYCRKEREADHRETWLGIYPHHGGSYDFITRRDEAFSSLYQAEDIDKLTEKEFHCDDGACIMPFCGIKKSSRSTGGRYRTEVILFCADTKEELLGSLAKFIKDKRRKKNSTHLMFSKETEASAKRTCLLASADMTLIKLTSALRTRFLTQGKKISETMPLGRRDILYSNGISGDLPIVCLVLEKVPCISHCQIISSFARACRYMKLQGEEFDLIIVCHGDDESDPYRSPIKHEVMKCITDAVGYAPLYRKGGIYITSKGNERDYQPFSDFSVTLDESDILLNLIEALRRNNGDVKKEIRSRLYLPASETKGEFTKEGFLVKKGNMKRPWSYIYSTRLFGTLLTLNSLGFTWYRNSRQHRLTPWSNDPLLECRGEVLTLETCSTKFDLAAVSDKVIFKRECALYSGSVSGISYTLEVGVSPNLPFKYINVKLKNETGLGVSAELEYIITPELGDGSSRSYNKKIQDGFAIYSNADLSASGNISLFVTNGKRKITLGCGEEKSVLFILGALNRRCDRGFYLMTELIKNKNALSRMQKDYLELFSPITDAFQIKCPDKSLENMFNFYLPYTASAVRIFGRTGFYQSGGAYGFRDQLQDAMCLGNAAPELLKNQILRCASKQFPSGDVLHWWHENTHGEYNLLGVRTRCSDDYLWLPAAVTEYIGVSGDYDILNIKISYLDSPPLLEEQLERCEFPKKSDKKESLFYHCIRALERGLSLISSENGIPLMGSCDWNDGFSLVGAGGRGTSVWLGRFLQITLGKFAELCRDIRENDYADKFTKAEERLNRNIEKNCFNGNYYIRGTFDDGSPLGDKGCAECKIDLLPQAFSVFSSGDNERTRKAMQIAYDELYRPDDDILCLFTPPFEKTIKNPGYIAAYVPGTRENGGQYTHAALWGAIAFFCLGENEKGYKILRACNSASKYENESLAGHYSGEPYAIAGDIYSNPDFPGYAGWTHYTGASGWLYRTILCSLLGYRPLPKMGGFSISPALSDAFSEFELTVKKHGTVYRIRAEVGKEDKYILDGKEHLNQFIFDKKEHYLKIVVAKKQKLL